MKKKKDCSVCDKKLKSFLNLGMHPCADTFLKNKKAAINLKKYPLAVGYCNCNHLTSVFSVSSYERYKKNHYSYTSNNSPVSTAHFFKIANRIIKQFKINKKTKVIEIGSNDGTFLKNIKDLSGAKILGIDPSDIMCNIAKKRGVDSLNIFFDLKNINKIKKKYGKFDILYGANVFNHIDDPKKFLLACKKILNKSGKLILEVPDLESLFKNVGFDTIYHEHRQYFSKISLIKIFKLMNIKILKIEKIDYMSGSLRIFSQNDDFKKNSYKIKTNHKKFLLFQKQILKVKKEILDFVHKNRVNNKVIVGIGAATKGNTLLNFCELNNNEIKCILETSPHKIGKYTPGTGIKIVNEKMMKKYDAAIILPWNITKHLHKKFLQRTKLSYTSIAKIVKNIK